MRVRLIFVTGMMIVMIMCVAIIWVLVFQKIVFVQMRNVFVDGGRVEVVWGRSPVEVAVIVCVEVHVNVLVSTRSMRVPVYMQKRGDNAAVRVIHLAGAEFFFQ